MPIRKVNLATRRWERRARETRPPQGAAERPATPHLRPFPLYDNNSGRSCSPPIAETVLTLPADSQPARDLSRLAGLAPHRTSVATQLEWEASNLVLRIIAATPPRPLLTARQVANMLTLSRSSVYRLAKAGQLPAYHLGRALRFDPVEVLQFLASRKLPQQGGA